MAKDTPSVCVEERLGDATDAGGHEEVADVVQERRGRRLDAASSPSWASSAIAAVIIATFTA
jgi:hypothetical protein